MVKCEDRGGGVLVSLDRMGLDWFCFGRFFWGFLVLFGVLFVFCSGDVVGAVHYVDASNYTSVIGGLSGEHTVIFKPGVYNDNLTVSAPLSLVSDTGDYRNSSVVFNDSFLRVNSSNVSVRGFVFENVSFNGSVSLLRVLSNSSNVRIEKNKFFNSTVTWFIFSSDANNLSVVDNYLESLSGSASVVNPVMIEIRRTPNSSIEGNFLNAGGNVTESGVILLLSNNTRILNNQINNAGRYGVRVRGGRVNISGIEIRGNVIQNSGADDYDYIDIGADLQDTGRDYIVGAINLETGFSGVVENNTLVENDDGIIVCDSCTYPDPTTNLTYASSTAVVRYNVFESNGGNYDVLNGVNNSLMDARYNFWGSADGPNVSRLWGAVNYSPFYADGSLTRFEVSNSSNQSQIQAVLDGVESGSMVLFRSGVYRDMQLNVDKPLTLVSDTGDYRTSGVVFTGKVFLRVNTDNVTVKGFIFDNVSHINAGTVSTIWVEPHWTREHERFHNLRIEKNKFSNSVIDSSLQRFFVYVRRSSHSSVVDNYFVNLSGDVSTVRLTASVYVISSYSPLLEGNFFSDVHRGVYLQDLDNARVLNNRFNNSQIMGLGGIEFLNMTNFSVLGNVVRNFGGDFAGGNKFRGGITIMSSFDRTYSGVVENNTLVGNDDGLIFCYQCDVSDQSGWIRSNLQSYGSNTFVIRGNNIYSNGGSYDFVNAHGGPGSSMDVRYNFWGSDGPNVSRLWAFPGRGFDYVPWFVVEAGEWSHDVVAGVVADVPVVLNVSGDGNGTVRNVTLVLNESVGGVGLWTSVGYSKPDFVGSVSSSTRRVYAYLEIEDNVSESAVQVNATITFAVPKAWLQSNSIYNDSVYNDSVSLMRFSNDSWRVLSTRVVNESSTHVVFSASTSGFSIFAITGIGPPPPLPSLPSPSESLPSSSGGGGGSVYVPAAGTFPWLFVDRQAVKAVPRLSPDESFVFSTGARDVVVTSVVVDVSAEVRNAVLVVASLRSRPSSISVVPEGVVYRYFGVVVDNVNEVFIEGVKTTFAVSKEWMGANSVGGGGIVLFAYDDVSSSWVDAGARMVGESDGSVLFEAETGGWEIFAIVKQGEKTATAEKPQEPEKPEIVPPLTDPADAKQDEVPPERGSGVPVGLSGYVTYVSPEPARGSGVLPLAVTVMVVLVSGVATFVFVRHYKKKKA